MIKNYLAFDLGASSGRAILGRIENDKLSLSEIHRFPNGPIEKNGTLYWDFQALCAEIKTGLRKALGVEKKIDGIAVDTWGVDYVLFKADGSPVRPPYHYRDTRTDGIPEQVFKIISEKELYAATGIQKMQFNTLYQLYAHQRQHPGDFADAIMLPMPDALTFMLNGDRTCEYTEASTTNLLDARSGNWDMGIIRRLGLPPELFPKIVPPGSPSLPLKPALQKEFGCGPIPIFKIGSHDTASAIAAMPARREQEWAYLSCGTWALFGVELETPILTEAARAGGFTNESGFNRTITFLSNIMGTWLLQETRRVWNERGAGLSYAAIAAMAREATPLKFFFNPNDVRFLSPGDMPAKIAAYCDEHEQGRMTGNQTVARAIYDSLGLCVSAKLETLEEIIGLPYDLLHIVGGAAQDRMLMQTIADATALPVIAGPVEATAAGNIIGQALATGELPSLEAGREIVRNSFATEEFSPVFDRAEEWNAAAARFQELL